MDDRLQLLTELVSQQGEGQPRYTFASLNAGSSLPAHGLGSLHSDDLHVASSRFLDTAGIRDELSLTQKHSVTPQYLLTWPCSPTTLSDTQLQYPLELEINRPPMSRDTGPPIVLAQRIPFQEQHKWLSHLSMSQLNLLTQYYFTHYHPSCLVLDEQVFYGTHITEAMRSDFGETVSSCIVLVVCALGSNAAYYDGHGEWAQECEADVGIGFFNTARELFSRLERVDWSCVQCLLLMGTFASSKLRVYDAWHLTHRACNAILILTPLQPTLSAHQCQLFWIAYVHESQILAEFDLPSSGLGKLANSVPLPIVSDAPPNSRLALHQLFFLALITIRKLLNRILLYLYKRDQTDDKTHSASSPPADTPSMFLSASHSIINELDRQLEEWRACLPPELRFPPHSSCAERIPSPLPQSRTTEERLRGFLMARYCTAKSTIYRPFIFRALHAPWPLLLSDSDKAGARTAVSAAFMHCVHSGLLHEPLPMLFHPINTWRSFFAMAIQVSMVSRSQAAAFALPDDWTIVERTRQRIIEVAGVMSPTISRDNEILQGLL